MGIIWTSIIAFFRALIVGSTNVLEAYEICTAELKTSAQGLRDQLAITRAADLAAQRAVAAAEEALRNATTAP